MKYDFHTHTKYSSDGYIDPEKMVKVAIKKGLSGISITDHNNIKGALKTKKYQTDDLKVIIGSEVSTDRGEVIGLFLSQEIQSHSFYDVLDEIKDQDGLVVLPHPYDELRRNGVRLHKKEFKTVDLIEVFNSRCLRQKYNIKAYNFADKNNLNVIAGSDAHFASEVGKAGVIIKESNIRHALLKGRIEVFGEKSSIMNLGLTKLLKIWKKTRSG